MFIFNTHFFENPILGQPPSSVETVGYQFSQIFDAAGKSNQYLRIDGSLRHASSEIDDASDENIIALQKDGTVIAEKFEKKLDEFIKLLESKG